MHLGRHVIKTRLLACRQRAFTLIEMMVVIAVAAILLMIAVPSYNDAVLSSKLNSYTTSLVASAHQARSEALKRNVPVRLCVSTNGADCASGGWEQGWIMVFTDKDGNTHVIHREDAATVGFKISGSVDTVAFQPTGVASTEATFTVCRAAPTAGNQERLVQLMPTGRVTTSKTTNASCP